MDYLSDICLLCVQPNQNLKNITSEDNDGIAIEEKLNSFLMELVNFKPDIPKYACDNCVENLNYYYKFRQKCLQNIPILNEYLQKRLVDHLVKKEVEETSDLMYDDEITVEDNIIVKREFNSEEHSSTDNHILSLNKTDSIEELKTEISHVPFEYVGITESRNNVISEEIDSSSKTDVTNTNEAAQSTIPGLIPTKSTRQYECAYKDFMEWCESKKLKNITESVILAYFEYKTKIKKLQPVTLWSIYSMLKKTLNVKDKIEIAKFPKLVPYLKEKCVGYCPKKSKVLTREEIETFLQQAPDESFLLQKVILIIGIHGACRRAELLNLTVDDIEDMGSIIIIKLQDLKTQSQRRFIISNSAYIDLHRKYYSLRPSFTSSRRYFIKYVNGTCFNHVIGINRIRNVPKEIATYLNLPEPESYTGRCFRGTSAKLFVDL